MTTLKSSKFSSEFKAYLGSSGINSEVYDIELNSRFIRLHPDCLTLFNNNNDTSNNGKLSWSELNIEKLKFIQNWKTLEYIKGSNGFFKINNFDKLNNTKLYEEALVYGIDLSSGIAVEALDIEESDHVLDICCAPGAKLLMTADRLISGSGTVTGVDISSSRLSNTRALVKKYKVLHKVRLFQQDATKFNVLIPTDLKNGSKKSDGIKPFYAPKLLRYNLQYLEENVEVDESSLYDKIIVDAECTHDGSIHHILKYFNNTQNIETDSNQYNTNLNWSQFESKFLNQEYLNNLYTLQFNLLLRGYELLKPGGALVYSTCSLSQHQNERIILKFYRELEAKGYVLPEWKGVSECIDIELTFGSANLQGLEREFSSEELDRLGGAVRMDPQISQTSGLFIFKLVKPLSKDEPQSKRKKL